MADPEAILGAEIVRLVHELVKVKSSHAQELRRAVEFGVRLGYEKGAAYVGVNIEEAFLAFQRQQPPKETQG